MQATRRFVCRHRSCRHSHESGATFLLTLMLRDAGCEVEWLRTTAADHPVPDPRLANLDAASLSRLGVADSRAFGQLADAHAAALRSWLMRTPQRLGSWLMGVG